MKKFYPQFFFLCPQINDDLKRILVLSSKIVLTMIVVYIVLTIRYHKKPRETQSLGVSCGLIMVKTCLTPDEEQDAQKRINKCQEEECEEIKTLLRENDCDKIKSWLNKNNVLL